MKISNYKKLTLQFVTSIVTLIFGVLFIITIFIKNYIKHDYGSWYTLLSLYFACLSLSIAMIIKKEWIFYVSFGIFGISTYLALATRLGGGYYWASMLPSVFLAPILGLVVTTVLGYFKVSYFKKFYRPINFKIIFITIFIAFFGLFTSIVSKAYKPLVFFGGCLLVWGLGFMIDVVRKNRKNEREGNLKTDIETYLALSQQNSKPRAEDDEVASDESAAEKKE